INLASVQALSEAAGSYVDPTRFRGNLFLEDLPAWGEFSMIGRRYRIGEAEIEMTRPARRCAATTVDPATADTDLNVPVILRKLTGHLYCGIYARVTKTGRIDVNDKLEDLGPWDGDPNQNLPERTPEPGEWPRFVRVAVSDNGKTVLQNLSENWPLVPGSAGDEVRLHPITGRPAKMARLKLAEDADAQALVLDADKSVAELSEGAWVLVSGPYSV
ncbi:MAG: MOSC domain-containing protein, partial [Rhizobiales bacterium]|nr:MOSC domain-containing protein [Hyphomicrobiales bacterium]